MLKRTGRRSRFVGGVSAVVLVAGLLGSGAGMPEVPAAEAAAVAECAAADPAPQALDVTADDVVMVVQDRFQDISVSLRSTCGAGYTTWPYESCALPQPCLRVIVGARRTAAATSYEARSCHSQIELDEEGLVGSAARPTSEPDVYVAELRDLWTLDDDGDGFHGPIDNACAGAWDVTAAVTNEWREPSSASPPVTRARAFSLRRWSHLSTNAGPEPVRAGALVTVRGRLVRADWNTLFGNVAFAFQPVHLQRRTTTGAYTTVRTVSTDREGRLRTSLRAPSTKRCYRWVFSGTSTTASAFARGDCVSIRS